MQMFSKLFEILPDAEYLLSLEPEDLAGPLLVSLESREQIRPEGVISYQLSVKFTSSCIKINLCKPRREGFNWYFFRLWEFYFGIWPVCREPETN